MNKWHILSGCLLFAFLSLMGILTLCLPAKEFSENENRYLQARLEFTAEGLLSGTVQEDIQAFMNDQIPCRDLFNAGAVKLQKLLGKQDINGVYIGADGYYLEKVTESDIDKQHFEKNIKRIDSFAEDCVNIPVTLMLIPTAGVVLEDKLPIWAEMYDADVLYSTAQELLNNVQLLDIRAELESAQDEQLYYKTDHHWTTAGAQLGAKAYMEHMGREYAEKELSVFSDTFRGTLYSRILDSDAEYDTVELVELTDELTVECDGGDSAVYELGALEEKDKYKVFFGGNFAKIEISGGGGEGTLLIIKDSFANCFVPHIADGYDRIIMVDPRYYSGSLEEFAASQQVTEVLYLYEMSNFCADRDLAKVLL